MIQCDKCNKTFATKRGYTQHSKRPNCSNKCSICLKKFASKQSLTRHTDFNCNQRFECNKCKEIFNKKYDYNIHVMTCDDIPNKSLEPSELSKIEKYVNDEIIPKQDKQINHLIQNINNISNEKPININITNNIINSKINSNNKIKKIKRIRNTWVDTKPVNFHFGYIDVDKDEFQDLAKIDGYDEDIADMCMYERKKFKELPKNVIYKYETESLQTKGLQMLFSELQKNKKNRNVRMKKSKTNKCYIYDKQWVESKLKDIVTKICRNLCDYLYDKETSLNHFVNLTIMGQPKRIRDLRKHIENEILTLNKMDKLERYEIEYDEDNNLLLE